VSHDGDSILVGKPYIGNEWSKEPPEPWMADALCAEVGPEIFFPEKGGSTRDAKRVCAACDVRQQCLEYALRRDEHFGIWGGVSERDRRKMRGAA
jgi:WhiB family redox-sensing transcriptional regulator